MLMDNRAFGAEYFSILLKQINRARKRLMIRSMSSIALLLCGALFFQAESAMARCTRKSLQATIDSFIAAQQAGDASKMALISPLMKFQENMKEIMKEKALFNTALAL
jgi:hypothetical protein